MTSKEKILSWNTETKNILILSFAVFFVRTAIFTLINLQSSLNPDDGLGIMSIFVDYTCFFISNIIAPFFIDKLGVKTVLVTGQVAFVFYVITNFYVRWWTLLPGAMAMGLTSGPYWISIGVYLTNTAKSYSLRTKTNLKLALNTYNGVYFAIHPLSQISGSLVSSFILYRPSELMKHGQQNLSYTFDYLQRSTNFIRNVTSFNDDYQSNVTTEINITKANTCGSKFCPSYSQTENDPIPAPPKHIVYILFSIFLVIAITGLLIMLFLDKLQETRPQNRTCFQHMLSCCKLSVCDIKMLLLIPLFSTQYLRQSLLRIDFTKSYTTCVWGVGMVGYMMATYGTSSSINSLIFIRVAKHVGRVVLIVSATTLNIGVLMGVLWWEPVQGDLWVLMVVAAMWGMGDGILLTQCNVLIAKIFSHNTESAFTVYWTWQSAGFLVSTIFSYFICVSYKLYIIIAYEFIAVVLYSCVEVIFSRQKVARDIQVPGHQTGETESLT